MAGSAFRPSRWSVTRATYSRPAYRPALLLLWLIMLIAVASLVLGFLLVTLLCLIPSAAGNFALSRRVQRDLVRARPPQP